MDRLYKAGECIQWIIFYGMVVGNDREYAGYRAPEFLKSSVVPALYRPGLMVRDAIIELLSLKAIEMTSPVGMTERLNGDDAETIKSKLGVMTIMSR